MTRYEMLYIFAKALETLLAQNELTGEERTGVIIYIMEQAIEAEEGRFQQM